MSDWRSASRRKRNKIWLPSRDELQAVVHDSASLSAILKHYGLSLSSGNYAILKNRLWQEQIDFAHIKLGTHSNKGRKSWGPHPFPLEEILVEHSSYSRTLLKHRLLKEGLLKNQCYECGIGPEWNGKPLSLQMDHINGASDDNRIENLRMLCPNCHAQTETFGAKRKKGTGKPKTFVSDVEPEWRHRLKPHMHKVEHPDKERLAALLLEKSVVQIADQFGVSDKAIRDWAMAYQLSVPTRGYWAKKQSEVYRPTKEELEKVLWAFPSKEICRQFKTTKTTLAKWCKHYGLSRPPPGYWKKKANIAKCIPSAS